MKRIAVKPDELAPLRLPFRGFHLLRSIAFALVFAGTTVVVAEPIPLPRAVQLALAHSTGTQASDADVQRAFASYLELRNAYIPQLAVGSGLGWTYGFPLTLEGGAPAIFNVTSQSTLYNPAQSQFMKAARFDWQASQAQSKDQRNATIQDVSLSYAELAKWEARLARLQQEETQALEMETAVAERLREGVDSGVDLNKAKLVTARIRLRVVEARGSADILRRHLSALTGLPASDIQTAADTIPALPPVAQDEDAATKAADSSPVLKFANEHALAESLRAKGEHRAMLPSFDFAAQYARLSKINNYDVFYRNYQPNNATVGVAIRFPFLNFSQKERAKAADAAALKAEMQARAAKDRVSEETLKLQHAVEQLAAAREVAMLEFQVAQAGFEAARTRIAAATGALHELADAREQANERFLAFQDADFEYQRARITLLRATGDLESWAMQTAAAK